MKAFSLVLNHFSELFDRMSTLGLSRHKNSLFIAFLASILIPIAPAVSADIVVGNFTGSVTSYEQTANGDVAPLTELTGAATQFSSPFGIAVDDAWLYVTDQVDDAIYVFPINSSGDVAPTRVIQGANTTIDRAAGLTVDDNWIYLADDTARAVLVFPKDGDGDIPPTRTIAGPNTTFVSPFNIALDGTWMYVTNGNRDSVAVFPIDANGDVAPTRSIEGASTGFGRVIGIAVDANWIYVSGETVPGIFVFPIDGDGDIAPTRLIQGAATLLNNTYSLVVDDQWIYAAEWGFSVGYAVNIFPIGADGNVAPTRRISGGSTQLDFPVSIALSGTAAPTMYSVSSSVVGGNGSVSCDPTSVPIGGSSTCTAVPDQGYQVSGWTGDCASAVTSTVCNLVNIQANQSSTVSFEAVPVVTFNVSATVAGSNGSVSCDPTSVPIGGSSTCTAVPDQGYEVSGWTGDCASAVTSTVCNLVNIQANQSSTVSFVVVFAAPTPVNLVPVPGLSRTGLALLIMVLLTVAAVRYRW
jgi:hypothetical protein